ncbi:hypothetical protein OSC52_18630 [Clostridium pasteurianum]|uniref:hypothetical protein n=1 Tax=Clostridium pasteurianum TaxID=1501 RepID=UPI002260E968|nr:hypothetical protein [Clostridium pasteurianum]UZW13822.1 hypothetical protein OSC52_18630 [Clostridium pasteurianum]
MDSEIVYLTGYHGTELNRGNRMLDAKEMELSSGDKHWLGDGSYFFKDDFYAFKWIKDMYKHRYKKEYSTPCELFENYSIILANLGVNKDRIFDMTNNPRHKIVFDSVFQNCKNKKEYSERFRDNDMAEGVVLNIMFKEMDYIQKYDLVIATFTRRRGNYKNLNLRLDFMPETQYCVKNIEIVVPLELFDCINRVEEFEQLIQKLNFKSDNNNFLYNKDKKFTNRKKFKM